MFSGKEEIKIDLFALLISPHCLLFHTLASYF